MYGVVRRYTSPSDLAPTINEKRANLEQTMRGIPGFVAYYLVNQGDAIATVTICQDRAGTEESLRRAAEWIKTNVPDAGLSAPEVTQGEVLVSIGQ
jgi:hypothetical protein